MEGEFFIDAPNLTYFKFYGNIMYFDIEYSSHLEEVDLYFGLEYKCEENGFFYSAITDFKHVKVLTVYGFILKVIKISVFFSILILFYKLLDIYIESASENTFSFFTTLYALMSSAKCNFCTKI